MYVPLGSALGGLHCSSQSSDEEEEGSTDHKPEAEYTGNNSLYCLMEQSLDSLKPKVEQQKQEETFRKAVPGMATRI